MPVKNAGPWLKECLDSILSQSVTTWELVAVDDHSNDDSLNLLTTAAERDPRIKVLKNAGSGIISALETARTEINGTWVSRMDADDIMPKNKLQVLLELLNGSETSVATGKVQYFGTEELSDGYKQYETWLNERMSLNDHEKWKYRECTVAGANWMTHIQNLDWDGLQYPEDYDLVFHWHKIGCEFRSSEQITHRWRDHTNRTSKTSENYKQEAFFQLKIQRFLEQDYHPKKSLFILGDNQKSKLAKSVLESNNVEVVVLGKDELEIIGPHLEAQILVAVYPSEFERQQIIGFLDYNRFQEGVNWWWL